MSISLRIGCDHEGCMAFVTYDLTVGEAPEGLITEDLVISGHVKLPTTWNGDSGRVFCGAHA